MTPRGFRPPPRWSCNQVIEVAVSDATEEGCELGAGEQQTTSARVIAAGRRPSRRGVVRAEPAGGQVRQGSGDQICVDIG